MSEDNRNVGDDIPEGDKSELQTPMAMKWVMWQPSVVEADDLYQIMQKRKHVTIQQTISELVYEEIIRMKTGE